MTDLEKLLLLLVMLAFSLVIYVILLRNNVKKYKRELELKKGFINPADSPAIIKLKCIDHQLENIGKKL